MNSEVGADWCLFRALRHFSTALAMQGLIYFFTDKSYPHWSFSLAWLCPISRNLGQPVQGQDWCLYTHEPPAVISPQRLSWYHLLWEGHNSPPLKKTPILSKFGVSWRTKVWLASHVHWRAIGPYHKSHKMKSFTNSKSSCRLIVCRIPWATNKSNLNVPSSCPP